VPEFQVNIAEHFRNGLGISNRLPINTRALHECINAKPVEEGLVPYEPVTDTGLGITISFPFPQLFLGALDTILADETVLYSVNRSAWTKSSISLTGSITPGQGPWQFVDMHNTWLLFNGLATVIRADFSKIGGTAQATTVKEIPVVSTGCYHSGRLILGGFTPANVFQDDWQNLFDTYQAVLPSNVFSDPVLGNNWVMWSSIGGGDALWLFFPNQIIGGPDIGGTYSTYDRSSLRSFIHEALQRNELGFMPMPWSGRVISTQPLGNHVIVYGENGISAITRYSDPTPTYGLTELLNFGILGRGSVGVASDHHTFIDEAGFLWRIDADLNYKRLGYGNLLANLNASLTTIQYDHLYQEHYISDGILGYILTSQGLGEYKQVVTSVHNVGGELLGVSKVLSGDGLITTKSIDFGFRGIKHVVSAEVLAENIDSSNAITVAIDYRTNPNSAFVRTSFISVNQEMIAHIHTSGNEFRFVIKTADYSKVTITGLVIRYRSDDTRNIRSRYVSENGT